MFSLVALAALALGGHSDGTFTSVANVLRRTHPKDGRTTGALAQALAELGAEALPVLYGLIRGSGMDELIGEEWHPEEWACTPEDIPGLCVEALGRFEGGAVRGYLAGVLDGAPSFQERISLLRILECQASADGLALVFRNAEGLGDLELGRPSVRRTTRLAMAAALRADSRSWSRVEDAQNELSLVTLEVLVEAVGAAGRARGMDFLARLFPTGRVAQELGAEAMAELERTRPWDLGGETLRHCVAWQRSSDSAKRMRLARLAGELQARASVPMLIELQSDVDPLVRSCAEGALLALKGSALDAASWEEWYEREDRWHKQRFGALCSELAGGDPGRANQALCQLREHPLYRHDVARALAEALPHLPAGLLPAVGAELRVLTSRWAVPGLVAALEGKAQQRAMAWQLLRTLTGEDRELTPRAWQELLGT